MKLRKKPTLLPENANVVGYEHPRIVYMSYGLCGHLRKDYGFPTSLEEIKEARVPTRIRGSSFATQKRFLRGVLTKAYLGNKGCLRYNNKSRKFLKDLKETMRNLGVTSTLSLRKHKGVRSYKLALSPTSVRQLEEALSEDTQP
ncbi:MAG: hypothetical protein GWO20_07795 [Candidatus Korarchaeota archaeon]|nr:hypothetical protein [Candidatus Korarchaeota archaeon]NIW13674.1 hypothetical protein [Candidatus Thorarchaeota archaeon]NIW51773.1 hypothetical protein [Candidatus Korarchaeota archaeon]